MSDKKYPDKIGDIPISEETKRAWAKEDRRKDKMRQSMTFYRSSFLHGYNGLTDMPDAIDQTIEWLLRELMGENLCLMKLESVTILPVTREEYPLSNPARAIHIMTITASPLGVPKHGPQSRVERRKIDEWEAEQRERLERVKKEQGNAHEH